MTKFDTSSSLPTALNKRHLNVLPVSRSEYEIGQFDLYHEFPDMSTTHVTPWTLAEYESLRVDNITSESNAINALVVSNILDDFLGAEGTIGTFNGRMGSGEFNFKVNRRKLGSAQIHVNGAQIEIDGGFENSDSITILEAKNVRHNDFHIRQLYYPLRKYADLVKKPLRLVFSQYTNLTYYLFEYEFQDLEDYSSITLLNQAAYTFGSQDITEKELYELCLRTKVLTDDNQNNTKVPFIQADRFDRVVALMEKLEDEPLGLNFEEAAIFLGTVGRQVQYYTNAGIYLGLLEKPKNKTIALSVDGARILRLDFKRRQLAFAQKMFEHEIFNRLYKKMVIQKMIPNLKEVIQVMSELDVCNASSNGETISRRARSVIAWLRWLKTVPTK